LGDYTSVKGDAPGASASMSKPKKRTVKSA